VLAGGDGTRLRGLTRQLTGDDRPKQFCAVLGGPTLLEATRRRLARAVSPRRTLFSLARAHERYFRPALAGVDPATLVVQPANRGTAPAVLYAIERIARVDPQATVVVLPSDHHVADDAAFMAHVETAVAVAAERPPRVVLLGIVPDQPEVAYGWIEPGPALEGWAVSGVAMAAAVRRFREKPGPAEAAGLLAAGGLWNSFVLVGRTAAFLALFRDAMPGLPAAFAPLREVLGSAAEGAVAGQVYERLVPVDLSRDVLAARPGALAVVPVRRVAWSDLGEPRRVRAARAGLASGGRAPAAGRRLEPVGHAVGRAG
jgi:mannose-1-phosphate guanylyltransferase